ncbi:MAG: pyrroline-5-carboxylate reductase [Methanomassiliicoccaceae archaeon]|nr:pyrroline-5-carboxylate reductase [Methanomassiliicoccaceae archaeon]
MPIKIGFIGAGRMAEAMMRGLIAEDVYSEDEIAACDPIPEIRERVAENLGIAVYETASEVAGLTNVLVIAVKPAHVSGLFQKEGLSLGSKYLIISIAAGIGIGTLESYVPDARVVRVMPNHCCMVLDSASGYSRGSKTTDDDMDLVEEILSSMGLAFEVKEKDLDAVTGVSGSSPAFFYMFAEAVAEAGKKNGLPGEIALELAAQSMIGAGRMMLESGMTPKELVESVCSPGGTTIEGVKVLEEKGLKAITEEAVEAAIKKSRQLGG